MSKKTVYIILIVFCVLIFFAALNSDSSSSNSSSSGSYSSSRTYSSSSSRNRHTCEATGCTREGTRTVTGFDGGTEYYCSTHYNKIVEIWDMMNGY